MVHNLSPRRERGSLQILPNLIQRDAQSCRMRGCNTCSPSLILQSAHIPLSDERPGRRVSCVRPPTRIPCPSSVYERRGGATYSHILRDRLRSPYPAGPLLPSGRPCGRFLCDRPCLQTPFSLTVPATLGCRMGSYDRFPTRSPFLLAPRRPLPLPTRCVLLFLQALPHARPPELADLSFATQSGLQALIQARR